MPFRPQYATIKVKQVGINDDRVLVCDNGIVAGHHMVVSYFDDFLGDVIADQWGVDKGSDGSAANFALSASVNGMLRATCGAGAGASMAANGVQLHQALQWKANAGNLEMEARIKLSAITNIAVFVGFTDQIAALEMPIHSAASANTITTNATDAVGFFFDTSMTDDKFWLAGVKADTAGTHVNSTIAPVANTWVRLKIEVDSSGNATGFINGVKVGVVANAVTATVALTPVVAAFTRSAATATIDVDYIDINASRV
jgi:hypothetical protein